MAAWRAIPNVSEWVLHTLQKGYRIQFWRQPSSFNGLLIMIMGTEQALVMERRCFLFWKRGPYNVSLHQREILGSTAATSYFRKRMESL